MDADGSWSTQGLLCGSRGGAPSAWPSPCCASPGGRAGAGPSASCVFVKPPQLFPGTHISLSAVVTSRSWDPLAVFETTSLSKKTRGLCQEHLFLVCVCVCACGRSICFWCACAHVVFVTCVSALTGSLAPFPVSPGEGNGNHSSVLAWRIPGTGEPGGLPSMGLHRVGHD